MLLFAKSTTLVNKKDISDYSSEYSEEAFADKIKNGFHYAGLNVIFLSYVCYNIVTAESTPIKYKLPLYGALGYFILPVDIIPDVIPAFGYADDAAILIAGLSILMKSEENMLKNQITIDVIDRSKESVMRLFPNKENEINKIIRNKFPFYYE